MHTVLSEIFSEMDGYGSTREYDSSQPGIDPTSKDFADNYIDNFTSFQMRTPDSDSKNHYFKIFFANGKSRKFNLNDIPAQLPPKFESNGVTYYNVYIGARKPDGYTRDSTGLIYPTVNGRIQFNTRFTPNLINTKTKIVIYQQYLLLMQLGAGFANIIGSVSGLDGIK